MSVEQVIASYLKIAYQDLEGAKALSKLDNRNSIYLSSQAAEKVIRAVLTSENIHGGIKHQLSLMVDQIPDENPIKPLLRNIEVLSQFATSFRYPTTKGRIKTSPKKETFDQHASDVEKALKEASSRFNVDLKDKDVNKEAGNSNPIR